VAEVAIVQKTLLRRIWGEATAALDRSRRLGWVDALVFIGLAGILYGVFDLAGEWRRELHPVADIDLSLTELPRYTFYSLSRGLLAYVLSLAFTLAYGYWAAKDHVAERVLVPLLDILQSIPVLGFMPGLVLALVALFPRSNVGLELTAILMIFTGQAWNMTFSFYHSLRSVPLDQREVATVYRFTWWQRFRWVELPFSTMGLVWNSMMSMAGGWFFLMINEAFQLGDKDFRLQGLGSYMSVAVQQERYDAMLAAIFAMVVMIVSLDQLIWRPVVVWAQKFRVDEGGYQEAMSSWFLNWLRHSRLLDALTGLLRRVFFSAPVASESRLPEEPVHSAPETPAKQEDATRSKHAVPAWAPWISLLFFLALLGSLAYGAWALITRLLLDVSSEDWLRIGLSALVTLGRVLLATVVGTLWAVPAGLAIGLSPRLSRVLQPVVQVVASFPAPMLFPLVLLATKHAGISLEWSSILLMLLGTQWYILFNVIAGSQAIPADLREAARSYRTGVWQRFWVLYLPAIFPYLVTGWVTAAGGAWNASIVAEYVTSPGGEPAQQAHGLGAEISAAAAATPEANIPVMAASILVMSAVVVLFNRTVWRRCYELAEKRFSLNK